MVRSEGARDVHHGGRKKWLKSPGGWGLANIWFDKYPGVPRRGSPLETVFILLHLQRTQQQLLATRALVQSTLPAGKAADPAIRAFEMYCDTMLPFLEKAAETEQDDARKFLEEFVKHPVRIDKTDLNKRKVEILTRGRSAPGIKSFKLTPKIAGV